MTFDGARDLDIDMLRATGAVHAARRHRRRRWGAACRGMLAAGLAIAAFAVLAGWYLVAGVD